MKHPVLKAFGIIIAAIMVGAIAGVAFFGVTKLTGVYDVYKNVKAEATQTVNEIKGDIVKSEKPEIKAETEKVQPIKSAPSSSAGMVYDVSEIAESVMPSIVAITGTSEYEMFSWWGQGQTYEAKSSGSGIIIGEDDDEYMIVTNNHVVENTKSLVITFIDDTTADAEVKGRDSEKDVAVISVKKEDLEKGTADHIKIAQEGDSDNLKVGEPVVAIGNALGYGQSVTYGIISALGRSMTTEKGTMENLIQTDAAINPGNSGGALLNMSGEVIGISDGKYASTDVEGMCYAIPISNVRGLIETFSNAEVRAVVSEEEQGYIGIQGQNIDDNMSQAYDMPKGIYIYKIVEGVPAENSELREKDIITKLDGQTVESMEELKEFLTHYAGGDKVTVTVRRLEGTEYVEKNIELILARKSDVESD